MLCIKLSLRLSNLQGKEKPLIMDMVSEQGVMVRVIVRKKGGKCEGKRRRCVEEGHPPPPPSPHGCPLPGVCMFVHGVTSRWQCLLPQKLEAGPASLHISTHPLCLGTGPGLQKDERHKVPSSHTPRTIHTHTYTYTYTHTIHTHTHTIHTHTHTYTYTYTHTCTSVFSCVLSFLLYGKQVRMTPIPPPPPPSLPKQSIQGWHVVMRTAGHHGGEGGTELG